MTVIAWDGQCLAVDRQATYGEASYEIDKSKMLPITGEVLAIVGNATAGMAMMAWYEAGADPDKFPQVAIGENGASLIVASQPGKLKYYQDSGYPIQVLDSMRGFGNGSEFALGAMMFGATAEAAVRMACCRINGCGMGVDIYDMKFGIHKRPDTKP
jgi:hypothetical protein